MSDTNQLTLDTYEKNMQTYIEALPERSVDVRRWIDDALKNLPEAAKILEIGSGPGRDADYIESKGFKVECTDAAESFVKRLQENGREVRKLNIVSDPLQYGYDMIFANAVFLHLTRDELVHVIVKCFAALNPGGKLVFSLKRGDDEETTDRKMHGPRYFCYWQPEQIEALLFNLGFDGVNDRIVADSRGADRPAWLMLNATKGRDV